MSKPRGERLAIYFERLGNSDPADTYDAALALISRVLEEVEDEYSEQPNDSTRWMELDRMFPPQPDMIHQLSGRPGVTRATTRGHHVYIGDNGSFEFWTRGSRARSEQARMVLSKTGADGKGLPA